MIVKESRPIKEERTKIFSNVIFKRPVAVVLQTANNKITGNIHVRPDDRLRDELNKSELFLAVTDANIYDLEGKLLYHSKFLAVNVSHIIWLVPQNEITALEDEQ